MKRCTRCGEVKVDGDFYPHRGGLNPWCKSCESARQRHKLYGIDAEGFERMLTAQGRACAICGCSRPRGNRQWHLDHDHGTGKVRGILCSVCNKGLGHFRDSIELLAKARNYLLGA